MSSSYSDGKRIALDITDEKLLTSEAIKKIVEYIRIKCDKDVPLSTHYIQTEDISWDSVVKYDPFFDGVECVKEPSDFAKKVKIDRVLTGLDVARYIASKVKCTHLKLEKLVYYAYADYLCSSEKKLFKDVIYAFTHGPVIDSVYQTFKRSGIETIYPSGESKSVNVRDIMPFRSRILFAKDGADKLLSIDNTLSKYAGYSASQLVDFTHKEGTPWSRVDSTKPYEKIPDNIIKKFHYLESK